MNTYKLDSLKALFCEVRARYVERKKWLQETLWLP